MHGETMKFAEISNFMKILQWGPSCGETDRRTDEETDMTK